MRPKVKPRKGSQFFIAIILPKALGAIGEAKLSAPPSERNVRDLVAQALGRREEFKSQFIGQPSKVSCLKVPRHVFTKDLLDQLDKRKCYC